MDYVIHGAAFADVGGCIKYYDIDFNVNVVGTFNVIEAAKDSDVKKITYISSASVYATIQTSSTRRSLWWICRYNLNGNVVRLET